MSLGRLDKFLIVTIILDVMLLTLSPYFVPPLDGRVYGILAVLVVSPILAYLIVYRLFDRVRT